MTSLLLLDLQDTHGLQTRVQVPREKTDNDNRSQKHGDETLTINEMIEIASSATSRKVDERIQNSVDHPLVILALQSDDESKMLAECWDSHAKNQDQDKWDIV
jgi:hypothetical protein